MPLHTEAFTHRSFYTEKILHREAFSQTSVCGKELWAQTVFTYSSFHTEKPLRGPAFTLRFVFTEQRLCGAAFTHWSFDAERPLHRQGFYAQRFSHGSFTQRSFDTEKRLNRASFIHRSIYTHKSFTYTQSFYTQTLLRIEACSQSLQTEGLTQRGLYTEQLLHTDAFTQRCTEQLLHTNAPRLLRTEVFTHKLYTEKPLHRASFKHRSIYTQKLYTHTQKLYTHTPVHTELLHTDAFTHRSLFTEQGLHRAAFTQREAFAQSSLYNLIHTETLNTQMPKLLHRQVFTHRGIYTKVLHTDAADASTHKSFWTQMPFHTEAFTQRGFDIYTPMHTEAFRHRWFFRESQKLWHREAFTQRIFYTQKLLHTSFSTEAFTQRSFWARAFTHRRLYKQKACTHRAFTHRSFYIEKPLHTDAFPQKNRFHRAAFTHFKKSQFYVFDVWPSYRAKGLHPALKIAILDVGQSFCVKWVAPDLVKSHFYTSFISRETVVPDDPKWIKSQFYTNSWTFASDVKKTQFSHSYCRLAFMPRLHLNFQNTPVFDGWPSFRAKGLRRALPNLHFATCLDVRPARSLSPQTVAAGPRTNKTRISPHVWVSDTPQRVTFRKPPPGCRCRQREIEELEKSDFAGVHIQFDHWKLAELLCSNSCATISVQMTLQAGLL